MEVAKAEDTDKNPRIQARLTDDMAGWLAGREERMQQPRNHNRQAMTELGLWRAALEAELRRIRLTPGQANCIADVCNGWLMDASLGSRPGLVYAECYDAFRIARESPGGDLSSYGAKHGPEGGDPAKWEQDLLDYLGRLGPVADHALRDAVARWWDLPQETEWDHEPDEGEIREHEIVRWGYAGLQVEDAR